jgi:hypothetical protein
VARARERPGDEVAEAAATACDEDNLWIHEFYLPF